MNVEIATAATPELVAAFARLIPQLSSSNPPPTAAQVAEMIAAPATDVFVASDDAAILGVATLVVFRIPTALRAWIEDVVVDDAARGKGAGAALTLAMLDRARELGCTTVELTSRPSRPAANRLYQRIGFKQRETNVYRFTLE